MVTVRSSTGSNSVFPAQQVLVLIKRYWNDEWIYAPYLKAISCNNLCGPDVSSARMEYKFGEIIREQMNDYAFYQSQFLNNWYVQIRVIEDRSGFSANTLHSVFSTSKQTVLFTGIIQHEQFDTDRDNLLSGNQELLAYGMEYILQSIQYEAALVYSILDNGNPGVDQIAIPLKFNETADQYGGIQGNRSSQKYQPDSARDQEIYVHDVNNVSYTGDRWTADQVVENLLYLAPEMYGWQMVLDLSDPNDDQNPLASRVDVWEVRGFNLWDAMNRIVNRRNGLGLICETIGSLSGDYVQLRVFSVTEQELRIGDTFIPANHNRVSFTMPSGYPYNHLVGDMAYDYDAITTFDAIEVVGEPILQCGTIPVEEGTNPEQPEFGFMAGWTDLQLAAYKDPLGTAGTPADLQYNNDKARDESLHEDVYSLFQLQPDDYHYFATPSLTGENIVNLRLFPNDDGTFTEGEGPFYTAEMRFLNWLPFIVGHNYISNDPPDLNDHIAGSKEFLPLLGFVRDTITDTWDAGEITFSKTFYHQVLTNRWHRIDQITNTHKTARDGSVRPLPDRPGVRLSGQPNHYFGGDDWNDDALTSFGGTSGKASITYADWDFRSVLFTCAWRGFVRQTLRIDSNYDRIEDGELVKGKPGSRYNGPAKIKTIHVKEAQYWCCARKTVYDKHPEDPTLLGHVKEADGSDFVVLRNDIDLLRSVAIAAAVWYLTGRRQSATIPFKRLGSYVSLGTYINDIQTAVYSEPVRTVVTGIAHNFNRMQTTVETNWQANNYSPNFT